MEEGVDELEVLEPCPDVHALFVHYSDLYFEGMLGACCVKWSSSRMTLCAGVCHFQKYGGCEIRLSEPLLKYRSTKDMKETLLHEMIHAYIFLLRIKDDGDHGSKFREIMNRINTSTCLDSQRPPGGYGITVFHTFRDEVAQYRNHWWKCNQCGNIVKRAMNRPPQEADCRRRRMLNKQCLDQHCSWHMHLRHCGGEFVKIKEPESYNEKREREKSSLDSGPKEHGCQKKQKQISNDVPITKFFGVSGIDKKQEKPTEGEFPGRAHFLGGVPNSQPPKVAWEGSTSTKMDLQSSHKNFGTSTIQHRGDPFCQKGRKCPFGGGQARYLGESPKSYLPGTAGGCGTMASLINPPPLTGACSPSGCTQGNDMEDPTTVCGFGAEAKNSLHGSLPGASNDRQVLCMSKHPAHVLSDCKTIHEDRQPKDLGIETSTSYDLNHNICCRKQQECRKLQKPVDQSMRGSNSNASNSVIDLAQSSEDDGEMDIDIIDLNEKQNSKGFQEATDRIVCPGCGKEWTFGSITNDEFDAHLNQCL